MLTNLNLINEAIHLHQNGFINEAIVIYRKILSKNKKDHQIMYFLGTAYLQIGSLNEGIKLLRESIKFNPLNFNALYNIGKAFQDKLQPDKALSYYKQALKLKPDFIELIDCYAMALKDLGKFEQAIKHYEQAINFKNDDFKLYNNLGSLFLTIGKYSDAVLNFQKAITLRPEYAEAYFNLGNAFYILKEYDNALNNFNIATTLKPNFVDAFINRGNVLSDLKKNAEAEKNYLYAIQINPNSSDAYYNYGNLLFVLKKYDEAILQFKNALKINPNFSKAYINLGNCQKQIFQFSEAKNNFNKAIHLSPDYSEAYINLASILEELGEIDKSHFYYKKAIELKPNSIDARSGYLFSLNYSTLLKDEIILEEAKKYGTIVSAISKPKFSNWFLSSTDNKIKIGFVSGDLRNHPVGYFIEALIKYIEKSQFDLYAFISSNVSDDLTERIKPFFKKYISIFDKDDYTSARLIHQEGINILIDLSGHTANHRLPVFSFKPAPVQISYLGYFATTGLPEMDIFLGDPYLSPISENHYFTEKVYNLKNTWLCFTPPNENIKIFDLPALKNGYLTFGYFGNLSKMNDNVITTWSIILNHVSNSKLFIKSKLLTDEIITKNIKDKFLKNNVTSDRLILEGPSPRFEYFNAYNGVDIILDTFPYPGGTTSAEALWMGVPVITMKGNNFLSRLGESIAHNTNRAEWIADSNDDYINKVVSFSADLKNLAIIRSNLRNSLSKTPLFEGESFSENFSATLRLIWEKYKPTLNTSP